MSERDNRAIGRSLVSISEHKKSEDDDDSNEESNDDDNKKKDEDYEEEKGDGEDSIGSNDGSKQGESDGGQLQPNMMQRLMEMLEASNKEIEATRREALISRKEVASLRSEIRKDRYERDQRETRAGESDGDNPIEDPAPKRKVQNSYAPGGMTAAALQDAIDNTSIGGITGYEKGRNINRSERHFKDELISLGINTETADELF